jgi:hypothetical protein
MDDFDLQNCTMALKVIDAFLDNQRGFRKTLGELKGTIILLRDRQPALNRVLLRKWSLLHEFDAYTIYRRLPSLSGEQKARIDSILVEMQSDVLEAMGIGLMGEAAMTPKPPGPEGIVPKSAAKINVSSILNSPRTHRQSSPHRQRWIGR